MTIMEEGYKQALENWYRSLPPDEKETLLEIIKRFNEEKNHHDGEGKKDI